MATYYDVYKKYGIQNRDSVDYYGTIPFRISLLNWDTPSGEKLRLYCPKSEIVVIFKEQNIAIAIPKLDMALIYELDSSWGDIRSIGISPLKHSEDIVWEINWCGIKEHHKSADEVDEKVYEALMEPWE